MPSPRSQGPALRSTATPLARETGGRRALVLRAAAEAFADMGYQGTGLSDICRGAGIAKPTVYHHFPSKASILYELLDEYMSMLIAAAEGPDRRELGPPEQLLEIMKDMLRSLDTHPGQVRAFYENAVELLPNPLRGNIQQQRRTYSQHLDHVLLAGQDAGVFQFEAVRLTRLSVFALCGWPYNWYRRGGDVATDDIATHVWELVMSGIRQ